jgi:hypothetical protein
VGGGSTFSLNIIEAIILLNNQGLSSNHAESMRLALNEINPPVKPAISAAFQSTTWRNLISLVAFIDFLRKEYAQ